MIKTKDGFLVRKFGDKHIVVAIGDLADEFHSLITLNETGSFIFKKLENGIEYSELLNSITETFAVDETTAKNDLDVFLNKVKKAGLLYE